MSLKASKATAFTVPVKVLFLGDTLNLRVQAVLLDDPEFKKEMNRRAGPSVAELAKRLDNDAAGDNDGDDLGDDGEDEGEEVKQPEYNFEDYDFAIAAVVTEWDYLDDNGKPMPITEEVVADMPWQLKRLIWPAILEAISPKALTQPMRATGSGRKGR